MKEDRKEKRRGRQAGQRSKEARNQQGKNRDKNINPSVFKQTLLGYFIPSILQDKQVVKQIVCPSFIVMKNKQAGNRYKKSKSK